MTSSCFEFLRSKLAFFGRSSGEEPGEVEDAQVTPPAQNSPHTSVDAVGANEMEKVAHTTSNAVELPAGENSSSTCAVSTRTSSTRAENEARLKTASMLLRLARTFNCFFLNRYRVSLCKPFIIDGYQIGLITPEVYAKLREFPEVFECLENSVRLAGNLNDYESRSKAVDAILRKFREEETFVTLKGWRDECYEVRVDLGAKSLMRMERSATCLFGIRQFGVDINGYVKHPELGLCLWLQKRSKTKQRWPGKMDNIVGGGLSVGYTVIETAFKESGEEAGIPEDILQNLKPIGTVSIFFESERGLSPNTEYVYDLELPLDFVPANQDGEVSEFHLYPVMEAFKVIMSPEFKTTSCPVALDFLIRHGVINLENEPELPAIRDLLHIPLADFYRKISKDDTDERSDAPTA